VPNQLLMAPLIPDDSLLRHSLRKNIPMQHNTQHFSSGMSVAI